MIYHLILNLELRKMYYLEIPDHWSAQTKGKGQQNQEKGSSVRLMVLTKLWLLSTTRGKQSISNPQPAAQTLCPQILMSN